MKYVISIFCLFSTLSVLGQELEWSKADTMCVIDKLSLGYCSCDSLKFISKKIDQDGRGKGVFSDFAHRRPTVLYTKFKKVASCGVFYNGKFPYGLKFIYDSSGRLMEIEEYYNEVKIGSCKM